MQTTISTFRIQDAYGSAEFQLINNELEREVENRTAFTADRLNKLDAEINRLTSSVDSTDVWVSIGSGILCGLIDILYVGEMNLDLVNGTDDSTRAVAHQKINEFIQRIASDNGYKGDRLNGAIGRLESIAPIDNDNYRGLGISSSHLHHLEDLAHHPTPLGLVAALSASFLRIAVFTDKDGRTQIRRLPTDITDLVKTWTPVFISGILYWLSCIAARKFTDKELSEQPKWVRVLIKTAASAPMLVAVSKIAHNWALHLVSDMGGSKNTPDGGKGIPGLFLSLLKEMAMFPPFNNCGLNKEISELYSNKKIDLRAELLPLGDSLKKQAIPVVLNEIIVSSYYFVSRLSQQYKFHGSWQNIEWLEVIPYGNRTIARMRTYSSGVFTAIDIADAAIQSYIKGGMADPVTFICNMALRVNIVGIGRFSLAIGNDIAMGNRRAKMKRIKNIVMTEYLYLNNAKIYILQGKTWIAAENAQSAIDLMQKEADDALLQVVENWHAVSQTLPDTISTINQLRNEDIEFDNKLKQLL